MRTKEAAAEVVRDRRKRFAEHSDSQTIQTLLTDDLVESVLEEAWQDQFEDDRTRFLQRVREIVEDVVEEELLNGESEQ